MKKIRSFIIILSLFAAHASLAQLDRANKYYNNYDYSKAIELYKKVLKKDDNTEALEKIANSYRLTKNYQQAEIWYSQLVKKNGIDPLNYFYYGTVLKNNNKPAEAKEQFKLYAASFPEDAKTELQLKSIDDIKIWISQAQQYEIKPVSILNTPHSEFSPAFFKNQFVYTSSKMQDMVNESKDDWDSQPFLNVLFNSFRKDSAGNLQISKSASSFPYPINTEYHDGPVCFNAEQNTACITRVNNIVKKKDKNFVNRPQLYMYDLKGNKWVLEKQLFPYNNNGYSVMHPCFSPDGQFLYFASDMPGGVGGMDIYVCKKEADSWSSPQNLGADVNTKGNEVFPYIRKDGTLFFSSDTHPGFGGLDVFSAVKRDDGSFDVKNMGFPFNSPTDDFGVLFNDNKNGYVSSDRPGGKGSDDIYSFISTGKFIAVTGKILLSKDLNDPAKNVQVNLLTPDGNIVKVTNTDSSGFFKFEDLDPDKNYMVKLNEEDPNLKKNKEYYMADQTGKIVRVTVINDKGGKFVFTNLPLDPNALAQLGTEEINIAGNILFGENSSKPLTNTKVNLVNEKGEVLQTVTTNEKGGFVFTRLPPDQKFFVKIDESDTQLAPDTKVVITNIAGKEIQSARVGRNGGFQFAFLSPDQNTLGMLLVEDNDLRFDFSAFLVNEAKDPLANTVINLVDEKGNIIKSLKTDAAGGFLFTALPADQDLLFSVDENDARMRNVGKLFLVDAKGKTIREITKIKGAFRFTILPSEEKSAGRVYAEDPELALQNKGSGNKSHLEWKAFLLNEKKTPVKGASLSLVNENNKIIQSIVTDEKGGFVFVNLPEDKNMMFRVDETDSRIKDCKVLYIVDEKGNVLKEIVKSGGHFVFTVLSKDEHKLGIDNTEDTELAKIKDISLSKNSEQFFELTAFVVDSSRAPLPETAIHLVNEKNEPLKSARTDKNGGFTFTGLSSDKNLLFSLDENDPRVKGQKTIYIVDGKGKVLKEVKKKEGRFAFTILPTEENTIGRLYTEDPWLAVTRLKQANASGEIRDVENLYYDYGKADLLPDAKQILDRIINVMKGDDKLSVVVESHTDSRSSYGFNIRLSRLRAHNVVKYMTSQGIPKSRVKGKGFGETQPVNRCIDGVTCSEEEYAKNRRTEFRIIRKQK